MSEQLLIFITGSIFTTLCFILKSWISHKYMKGNYKFQKMYEKRLEVINDLYIKSVDAKDAVSYVVGMQGNIKDNEKSDLVDKVKSFKTHYIKSRLWLDDNCCEAIDHLIKQHTALYKMLIINDFQRSGLGKDWKTKEIIDLLEKVDTELPELQEKLRQQFKETMKKIDS